MHSLFAWRYFKAKKSTNVINIIAWVCISAITVGTAALIIVLSVFNGFESLVKSLYATFYPDIKISAVTGKHIRLNAAQIQQLRALQGVQALSLVIEEKGILQNEDLQQLVHFKGVDGDFNKVNSIEPFVNTSGGKYDVGTAAAPKMVMGSGIASSLGVFPANFGSELVANIPRVSGTDDIDLLNSISRVTLVTAGTFSIQQDFDTKYVITQIDFLRDAMKLQPDEYTAVEIKAINVKEADKLKPGIEKILGTTFNIQNRYEQNQNLYAIMNMERWIFYAVLCLILAVAAFNMIGALTMLVVEKQKDIGILNALGAPPSFIKKIFLSEGFLLGIIGGGIGILISLILIFIQLQFHVIPLQEGAFLIDYFPVEIRITDILLVIATVLVIAFIASWFPSQKASKERFNLRSE